MHADLFSRIREEDWNIFDQSVEDQGKKIKA